jgi:hypothetical protein
VKVTNVGAAELKGPLIVNEVTFGNGLPMKQEIQEMQLPAGIACTQPPPLNTISCQNPAATLAPGQSITIRLKLKVSGPNAAAPFVENRTSVQFAGQPIGTATAGVPLQEGAAPPAPGANQAGAEGQVPVQQTPACATVPIDPNAPGPQTGGGGKTQSGPITIEKTPAVTTCDAGKPCSFDINVSNTSGKDIPGPITIAETPPAGVKTSNPPAPWTCVAAAALELYLSAARGGDEGRELRNPWDAAARGGASPGDAGVRDRSNDDAGAAGQAAAQH